MLLVQGPHPENHWISGKLPVPSKAFPTTQSRLCPHPIESRVAFPSLHTLLSECCVPPVHWSPSSPSFTSFTSTPEGRDLICLVDSQCFQQQETALHPGSVQ